MKKQTKRFILYGVIAAAAVIIGAIAIIFGRNGSGTVTASAQEKIDLGNVYLTELSYDKAVIVFTEAIEIEPQNADAYIGLAKAYMGLGDNDKALETLNKGYDKTGDERLLELINELSPDTETTVTTTGTTTITTEETTETTTEETTETTTEAPETVAETVPYNWVYAGGSYTIEPISDKEAHIEIFSDMIREDFTVQYNENVPDGVAIISVDLIIDNIAVAVVAWNHDKNMHYDNFWESDITVWLAVKKGDSFYAVYSLPHDVDVDEHKISIDVSIDDEYFPDVFPEDFDFSFYDYSNAELTAYYIE
jgi:tetratricopeptide (TPR) repeat protein